MLVDFLNKFNFKFIFKSSTENYKKEFLMTIIRVLEKYDEVMNLILPTLEAKEEKPIAPYCQYVQIQEKY